MADHTLYLTIWNRNFFLRTYCSPICSRILSHRWKKKFQYKVHWPTSQLKLAHSFTPYYFEFHPCWSYKSSCFCHSSDFNTVCNLSSSMCVTWPTHDIFFSWLDSPRGPRRPHRWIFEITLRHTTLGRTSLEEWSARRRDLYLTTHNSYKRQISMPPAGFEPAIPASERP